MQTDTTLRSSVHTYRLPYTVYVTYSVQVSWGKLGLEYSCTNVVQLYKSRPKPNEAMPINGIACS